MTSHSSTQASSSRDIYDARATSYDDSFHPLYAASYISWACPKPGQSILDLACGTGLVAILAKKAVGSTGSVTGIDVSPGMMAVGKRKAQDEGLEIQWIEGDIGDLGKGPLRAQPRKDGYDLITCAAALVLLADPRAAVKGWVDLLKSGGRIITDVPTERSWLAGVIFEEVGEELGIPIPSKRGWVKGLQDLEAWEAPGYEAALNNEYGRDEGGELFDKWVQHAMMSGFKKGEMGIQARELFVRKFQERCGEEEVLREENGFYVVIGRKE